MKGVFKQQRGSAAHQWYQKHKDALTNYAEELYIVRYVGNRLVLCGQHLADKWFMQEFLL